MRKYILFIIVLISACNNSVTETAEFLSSEEPSPVVETSIPQIPQFNSVTYLSSDEDIPNPERGFMIHTSSKAYIIGDTSYDKLRLRILTINQSSRNMGNDIRGNPITYPPMRIIHRYIILEDFLERDIHQTFLNNLQADFDVLREAGMKVVLRFSYTNEAPDLDTNGNSIKSFGDADKARILGHLKQLKPILHANGDVIAFVEAGFIGIWGEWWYTDHFGYPPEEPSFELQEDHFNDRAEILHAILDAVPSNRMVLVRTVLYKQRILSASSEDGSLADTPVIAEEAYNQTPKSRIGFHNDCFLTDEVDMGTFTHERLEEERNYMAAETRFVPMGGETCQLGPPIPTGDPSTWDSTIRYLCPTAIKELEKYHWSFLNIAWFRDVIDTWNTGVAPHDCFDDIVRRLGYRFVLLDGVYSDIVKPGDQFKIEINLRNDGFAAPYNPRLVEIVLRNTETGQLYTATLPDDPRYWQPDDLAKYSLKYNICTPSDLPLGNYELLFNLPDPESTLYRKPLYSIQLANQSVWEESTGFNNLLHTLSITENALSPECSQDSIMLERDETSP